MNHLKKALSLLLICLILSGASGCAKAPSAPVSPAANACPAPGAEFQADARVSYLGPAGTYTEEATRFFFRSAAAFLPESTVDEAIADLVEGRADYAVIPQENTIGGAVTNYVDALIGQEGVSVVGEVILPISQTLMAVPGAALSDIKTVCSHAQGIKQSEAWRAEHLPDAVTEEMGSTAAAASFVAQQGDKYLGTSYSTMDCQAFVERCLYDAGLSVNLAGSNAWYRAMTWTGTPEECRAIFGTIPVGAFLYILEFDGGERARGYYDGIGNSSHMGLYIGRNGGAIHSSYSRGGVYYSSFSGSTINGGWNRVGLWKRLDYGSTVNAILSQY